MHFTHKFFQPILSLLSKKNYLSLTLAFFTFLDLNYKNVIILRFYFISKFLKVLKKVNQNNANANKCFLILVTLTSVLKTHLY